MRQILLPRFAARRASVVLTTQIKMGYASKLQRHCTGFLSSIQNIHYMPVRYRYWADKVKRGPRINRFGYEELIFEKGHLPRIEGATKLPIPDYRPRNSWSEKRALFGQNDYIDILGDGKLHPVNVSYNVPSWLRGVQGNEMQLLLRKTKVFGGGPYQDEFPSSWEKLHKRIRRLYTFLNRKTKTGFMLK